jgi:multiple sugar transport system permease protein
VTWLQSTTTALLSVIIADVWNWTPFMFLLTLSALQSIPQDIYDAAHVDGAGGTRLFRFVTLPLLYGPLVVAVILRSMDNFRIFDKIFVLTGGGPGRSTETLNVLIYKTAFGSFELGYAAAIVTVFLIMMAVPYGLNIRFTRFEQR